MDPVANKVLLYDALRAEGMPADMKQSSDLMLARLMGYPEARHWSRTVKPQADTMKWSSFEQHTRATLLEQFVDADQGHITKEIERRWQKVKTIKLKEGDFQISHENNDELKAELSKAGWRCVLQDQNSDWYRNASDNGHTAKSAFVKNTDRNEGEEEKHETTAAVDTTCGDKQETTSGTGAEVSDKEVEARASPEGSGVMEVDTTNEGSTNAGEALMNANGEVDGLGNTDQDGIGQTVDKQSVSVSTATPEPADDGNTGDDIEQRLFGED